jgi:apolipoprotein N-acyltransferase
MVPIVLGLAAGVAGGAFFILASPSYGVWWLGLLALLPVYYVRLVSRRRGTVLASAVFALAFAFYNGKWYFTTVAGAAAFAALACLFFALLYFAVIEVAAWAGRRRPALAPLALPALWVGVDLVRTTIPGIQHAWFPLFAHTQVNNVALLAIASRGGVHAVTFVALGLAAALGHWLTRPLNPLRAAWAGLFVAAYATIWLNGVGVMAAAGAGPKFVVACVQNGPVRDWDNFDFLADYKRLTDEAAAEAEVDVVVWPETFFTSYDNEESREAIAAYAASRGVFVVYECSEKAAGGHYNVAAMVSPEGREVLKWRKRHPAPGERSLAPGPEEEYRVYDAPWGITGLLICYDDHFPDEARRLAEAGARVILIPSNDHGYGDDYFYRVHLNEAVFRAAENRCAVAVAGYDGFSAIVNGAGRVLSRKEDHGRGFITAEVAAGPGGAFYTRHPRVFSWLAGLAAALVLLGGVTGRRE